MPSNPVHIVCLDGYTLNPGDIDWAPVQALGELTLHDRTEDRDIVSRARGAAVVLTNKTVLSAATLGQLPDLKFIGVLATGVNVVDLAAARQRGVTVSNVPGYGAPAVAQHVFALLLELVSHTASHALAVHDGQWQGCTDFSFTVGPIMELEGKTLGIVGMGAIGQHVATVGAAFGMKIAAHDPRAEAHVTIPGASIRWASMDDLFATSDVLSLHCPLTEVTRGLVNAARLSRMKPTAILINTARGPLVDEPALAAALRQGKIGGAGLDVLSVEPPRDGNPLIGAPRCVVTPHIAWATVEARRRIMDITAGNIKAFMSGKPVNVVN